MSHLYLIEAKPRPTKLPSVDSVSLRIVNISKVLRCFTTDRDGTWPLSVATAMFTVACVLLVLPNRIRSARDNFFFLNGVRFIAALFSLLVTVIEYTGKTTMLINLFNNNNTKTTKAAAATTRIEKERVE